MEFLDAIGTLSTGQVVLLLVALVIAFGFECINGFHDTANAVATVIYTKSLKPTPAVVWSGIWNFIGVHAGGIGVAFSIVHLLPVDLLVNIKTGKGLAMVLALRCYSLSRPVRATIRQMHLGSLPLLWEPKGHPKLCVPPGEGLVSH